MKRNPKPFSVEIKKSRVQGQRHQLPPRRLLGLTPAQATKSVHAEEPQAVAKLSAAPRILPSILEPVRSHSEAVAPVRRKSSPRSKPHQDQGEFDLSATASKGATGGPAETPALLEAVSQMEASPVEEAAAPALEVQTQEAESAKTKSRRPRKKSSEAIEKMTASKPMLESEHTPEAAVIGSTVATSSKAVERRLTKRLAAAAQLPRNERWKRRLHPTSW
jgi:hypothetical protein